MKLYNTTDFSDTFLTRMITWCRKEARLPLRKLKSARFTNCSGSGRGRAWTNRILVRIGSADKFPEASWTLHGVTVKRIRTRVQGLVAITAHELVHMSLWNRRKKYKLPRGYSEKIAVMVENRISALFYKNRKKLTKKWSGRRSYGIRK